MRTTVVLVFLTILCLCGLAASSLRIDQAARVRVTTSSDQIDAARAEAGVIRKTLPAYQRDPLAAFEVKEIQTVERDLAAVEGEDDSARLVTRVESLQADWNLLVGLDGVLQKEHLI